MARASGITLETTLEADWSVWPKLSKNILLEAHSNSPQRLHKLLVRTFYWLRQGSNPWHSSSSLFNGRCKRSHVSPAVVAAVLAPSTRRLPTSGMLLGLFLAAGTPPITLPDSPRPVSQKYANCGSDRASVLIGFYYLRSGQACLWPRRISALRGRRLRASLRVQRMRRC